MAVHSSLRHGGAEADQAEIRQQTTTQNAALDGISSALDDLTQIADVRAALPSLLCLLCRLQQPPPPPEFPHLHASRGMMSDMPAKLGLISHHACGLAADQGEQWTRMAWLVIGNGIAVCKRPPCTLTISATY